MADFKFYVMAWDGLKAAGPILYESPPATTFGQTGWHPFTFNTGSLYLVPGATYVGFISASTLFDGIPNAATVGSPPGDTYANGGFVFHNNGANFGLLTNQTWNSWAPQDLAFSAVFGGVPLVAPTIVNMVRLDGQFQFSYESTFGQAYVIEYKNALTDPVWTPFQTNVGDGSLQSVTDYISTAPMRFFRLRSP